MEAETVVYGYYRGRLAMKRANALQFCALVMIPIVAVVGFFQMGFVRLIIIGMGVSTWVCAALFAVPIVRHLTRVKALEFARHARELL